MSSCISPFSAYFSHYDIIVVLLHAATFQMQLTLASMTLVLATSRGVVMAAAMPPANAPHTAPCQGCTGLPCIEDQLAWREGHKSTLNQKQL